MQPDPYYTSTPAQWIASSTTAFTGLEVVTDSRLPSHLVCRVDHAARVIHIAPGLPLDDFHWAVCRAVVRDMFGASYAPEFTAADRHLRVVPPQRARSPVIPADLACKECGRWLPTGQTNLS